MKCFRCGSPAGIRECADCPDPVSLSAEHLKTQKELDAALFKLAIESERVSFWRTASSLNIETINSLRDSCDAIRVKLEKAEDCLLVCRSAASNGESSSVEFKVNEYFKSYPKKGIL